MVANASALAEALVKQGFRLVSGGTDNHMMVVDLRPFDADLTGKEAQNVLDSGGVTLNKNNVPDDPCSPFVTRRLRIGTPSVTTQGMKEPEMAQIAALIAHILRHRDDAAVIAAAKADVAKMCAKFPRLRLIATIQRVNSRGRAQVDTRHVRCRCRRARRPCHRFRRRWPLGLLRACSSPVLVRRS